MTVHIPQWLLWAIGAAIGVPLLFFIGILALIGWKFGNALSRRK